MPNHVQNINVDHKCVSWRKYSIIIKPFNNCIWCLCL